MYEVSISDQTWWKNYVANFVGPATADEVIVLLTLDLAKTWGARFSSKRMEGNNVLDSRIVFKSSNDATMFMLRWS